MTETAFDVSAPAVAVLTGGRQLDIVARGGDATAIAWPGTGSHHRAMHRVDLASGGETIELCHDGEAAYTVARGRGTVGDIDLEPHSIVYVPRRTRYRFAAKDRLILYGGPCPPDPVDYGVGERAAGDGGAARVFDAERDGVALPIISRWAWLVVWPGVGADVATMNLVRLEPGEENQAHSHEASDDTIAILSGAGSIDDLDAGETHDFGAGDVVFVSAGVRHKVKADKGVPIVSAGGPCPPDQGMLRALGLA